ncbi:MAG: response regulator transcription factor [Chloroflexi bacterium]|uniref:Helix-turn-helix domain-containing protein n=1 Tax=Candidatus Chlorohelix allophototropha TaxID=3003348 RepID=A0A8T7M3E5_9CHLR|nr:response regulator transcription factor [Chloroflexota bacterium]WJW65864.1 helix-turn-helix domain-containing protein [Chloroflexota bacterium L227-S17]
MVEKLKELEPKRVIADLLIFLFLALTIWHSQDILGQFEEVAGLSWFLAIGLDAGTAYAAFIASDTSLKGYQRVFGGLWLLGLLASGYGLNVAYYASHKGNLWSWAMSAIFPLSLAFLGAIKPGFFKPIVVAQPTPTTVDPLNELRELRGVIESRFAYFSGLLDEQGHQVRSIAEKVMQLDGQVTGLLEDEQPSYQVLPGEGETAKQGARRLREQGLTQKQIAEQLGIALRTVQNYLKD